MGALFGALLFASSYAVIDDGTVLRKQCSPSAEAVATLRQGDPAEIRFSISGEWGACYKVAVETNGQSREGYLPAKAIQGVEEYQKERADAGSFDAPQAIRHEMEQVQRTTVFQGADPRVLQAAEMLKGNQNASALRLLEQAMGSGVRDAGVLAMAGMAAYQNDNPKLAARYWKESLAAEPNPSVEKMMRLAEQELAADQSSEKLFGARFMLRYDKAEVTDEQARRLVPTLDSEWARLSQMLGCEGGERIAVVIQGYDAYKRSTGAAEWSGGQYDGRIRVALLDGDLVGAQTRRAIAHEIVHACVARIGSWPAWLHEGLAQRLSGEAPPAAARAAVAQMAKDGELPSLKSLGQSWAGLSATHAQVAYTAAYLAVDQLYASYGADGVRNLLHNRGMYDNVVADLDRKLRQQ